jgi:ATP-dependent DNA helicase PIF1
MPGMIISLQTSHICWIDHYNQHHTFITDKVTIFIGEHREYFSSNTVDRSEINNDQVLQIFTPEFLSSLRTLGLPNHSVKLKVGTPIMLMRNIDQ